MTDAQISARSTVEVYSRARRELAADRRARFANGFWRHPDPGTLAYQCDQADRRLCREYGRKMREARAILEGET